MSPLSDKVNMFDRYLAIFTKFIYVLILYSVSMFFIEAYYGGADSLNGPALFLWSERLVAAILTFEILLRLFAHSSFTPFGTDTSYKIKSPEMLFDLIAVLPFYIGFFVPVEYLAAVRSMRILRLLKFYRASPIAHLVMQNLIKQRKKLRLITAFVTIIILFSGTIMHQLEHLAQPETFGSLYASIWWAVVTLTTVGYGDMSPITPVGQLVAMFLMITSIGVVGAMIAIVGTAFDVEAESAEEA